MKKLTLREIDALVAEKVMGIRRPQDDPPFYSTEIDEAWEVVEKLDQDHDLDVEIHVFQGQKKCVVVNANIGESVTEKTAPLAICLAALKALGESIEVIE